MKWRLKDFALFLLAFANTNLRIVNPANTRYACNYLTKCHVIPKVKSILNSLKQQEQNILVILLVGHIFGRSLRTEKPSRNPFDREVGQMVYDILTAEDPENTVATAESGTGFEVASLLALMG